MSKIYTRQSTSTKKRYRCADPARRESHSSKGHRHDPEVKHPHRSAEQYYDGGGRPEDWVKGYEPRHADARRDHDAYHWPHGDEIPRDVAGQAGTPFFPDASQQPCCDAEPATRWLQPPYQHQQSYSPVGELRSPAPSSLTYSEQHYEIPWSAPRPPPVLSHVRVEGWDTSPWQEPAAKEGGGGGGSGGGGGGGINGSRDDLVSVAGRRQTRFVLGDAANTEILVLHDPRHPRAPLNITIDATGHITMNALGDRGPG